jgi:hypothetical protein
MIDDIVKPYLKIAGKAGVSFVEDFEVCLQSDKYLCIKDMYHGLTVRPDANLQALENGILAMMIPTEKDKLDMERIAPLVPVSLRDAAAMWVEDVEAAVRVEVLKIYRKVKKELSAPDFSSVILDMPMELLRLVTRLEFDMEDDNRATVAGIMDNPEWVAKKLQSYLKGSLHEESFTVVSKFLVKGSLDSFFTYVSGQELSSIDKLALVRDVAMSMFYSWNSIAAQAYVEFVMERLYHGN